MPGHSSWARRPQGPAPAGAASGTAPRTPAQRHHQAWRPNAGLGAPGLGTLVPCPGGPAPHPTARSSERRTLRPGTSRGARCPVLCPGGPGLSAWCLARSASDVAPRRPLWACIKQGTSGISRARSGGRCAGPRQHGCLVHRCSRQGPSAMAMWRPAWVQVSDRATSGILRALSAGRGAWGPCARAVAVTGVRCNCRARCGASGTVLRRRVDPGASVGRGAPARRAAELPDSGRRRLRAGGAPGRSVLRLEGSGPTVGPGPGGSRAPIPAARRPAVRCRPSSRIENLLTLCQSAMRLTWGSRRMAVVRWHMRGDRGNAFPRWPVSTSEAARHLLTMAKTLARCSCRRDYDGSLHVTALTLADLKSHQKLHLGRPDES